MILTDLLLGAAMLAVSVVIHGAFMVAALSYFSRVGIDRLTRSDLSSVVSLIVFVLWMFLALVAEVWLWAHLFLWIGALEALEVALYFSTVTFTTLGYGDVVLSDEWRLLASFEAANGSLMLGWTTALIFAALQRLYLQKRPRP